MSSLLRISLLLSLLIYVTGCDLITRFQVEKMYGKVVRFPDSLAEVSYGEKNEIAEIPYGMERFVILFVDKNCSRCQVGRLPEFYSLIDSCRARAILPIVLFSGGGLEPSEEVAQQHYYPFSVFFDEGGRFMIDNRFLPQDQRFHFFLLDKNNSIRFVGNPIQNDSMMELFCSVVDSIQRQNYI